MCYNFFTLLSTWPWSIVFYASLSDSKSTLGPTYEQLSNLINNYILWSQALKLSLGSQNKLNHILSAPLDSKDTKFVS